MATSVQLLNRNCLSVAGTFLEEVVNRRKKKWQEKRFLDKHVL